MKYRIKITVKEGVETFEPQFKRFLFWVPVPARPYVTEYNKLGMPKPPPSITYVGNRRVNKRDNLGDAQKDILHHSSKSKAEVRVYYVAS